MRFREMNQKLRSEVSLLGEQVDAFKQENPVLKEELENIKSRYSQINEEKQAIDEENKKIRSSLARVQGAFDHVTDKMDDYIGALELFQNKYNGLVKGYNELNIKYQELLNEEEDRLIYNPQFEGIIDKKESE
jgi:chromosome segregation ATPase